MVNWRRWMVVVCALVLLPVFSPTQQIIQTNSDVLLTVDDPPLVALTFDDGPRNTTTGPLLDGLALREVPATFFLVGERIPGNEDLISRMSSEGHQIGVHTFTHIMLRNISKAEFDFQVGQSRALLGELLGAGDFWLRPPYGIMDETVPEWCGSPLILWSVDPEDWKYQDEGLVVSSVLNCVKDGDIILMHDIYQSSVDAALQIVDRLLDEGYCFVTVEQLMEQRHISPECGRIYRRIPPEI